MHYIVMGLACNSRQLQVDHNEMTDHQPTPDMSVSWLRINNNRAEAAAHLAREPLVVPDGGQALPGHFVLKVALLLPAGLDLVNVAGHSIDLKHLKRLLLLVCHFPEDLQHANAWIETGNLEREKRIKGRLLVQQHGYAWQHFKNEGLSSSVGLLGNIADPR